MDDTQQENGPRNEALASLPRAAGSAQWERRLNLSINVRRLEDGTYQAHCPQQDTNAIANSEATAIGRLMSYMGDEMRRRRTTHLI